MRPAMNPSIAPANRIHMKYSVIFVLSLILLSACSTPGPVVEKTIPVIVQKQVFVPLSQEILSDCLNRPEPLLNGLSNSELRSIALQWQNLYGPCLEGKLSAIRALQP